MFSTKQDAPGINQTPFYIVGATLIIVGLFVPQEQAHLKRRPSFVGPARWMSVRHSHPESGLSKTQAKRQEFDPIKGAASILTGTLEVFGKTIGAIFDDDAEDMSQTKKAVSRKDRIQSHKYRFVRNLLSGFPLYRSARGK